MLTGCRTWTEWRREEEVVAAPPRRNREQGKGSAPSGMNIPSRSHWGGTWQSPDICSVTCEFSLAEIAVHHETLTPNPATIPPHQKLQVGRSAAHGSALALGTAGARERLRPPREPWPWGQRGPVSGCVPLGSPGPAFHPQYWPGRLSLPLRHNNPRAEALGSLWLHTLCLPFTAPPRYAAWSGSSLSTRFHGEQSLLAATFLQIAWKTGFNFFLSTPRPPPTTKSCHSPLVK